MGRLSALLILFLLSACASTAPVAQPTEHVSVIESAGGIATTGFARATVPRDFVFPQDHGPHQEFAIEWWYYTGNLDTNQGRHFGYQLTFFRIALTPTLPERASDFATANIYMAHFALSDVAGQKFYAFERFSRGAAGLAGAQGQPFRIWLEDWRVDSDRADALPMRLHARQDDIVVDLTLDGGKPIVLQGNHGLSQKGDEPGNASYYYSLTRMPTRGTIRIDAQTHTVSGSSWLDREWSTSSLGTHAVGWDWLALQLSDGHDLMYARLRDAAGATVYAYGTLVDAAGATRQLLSTDVTLTALSEWQSPYDQARYPAAWRLNMPGEQLEVTLTPYLADQELRLTTVYWEGAVQVAGTLAGYPITGTAYVELTGYADQPGSVRVR